MSLGDLAKLTGKSRSTIKRWKENGSLDEKIRALLDEPLLKETVKEKPEIKKNICHGCGKDVSKDICICLNCYNKGITHQSLGIDIRDCVEKDEGGVPLWKANGFKSKEEAMEKIIVDLIEKKSLKGEVVNLGDGMINCGSV